MYRIDRIVAWIFGIAAAMVCVAAVGAYAYTLTWGDPTIRVSCDMAQKKVHEKLPIKKDDALTVNQIDFVCTPEGTVDTDIGATASLSVLKKTFGADVQLAVSGTPYYGGFGSGTFHVDPKNIELVSVTQTAGGSFEETVDESAGKLKGLFKKGSEIIGNAAGAVKDSEGAIKKIASEKATDWAAFALERVAVYKLPNDTKGWIATLVLDEVTIEDGYIVITLTLWYLLAYAGAALVVAGFAYVYIRAGAPGAADVAAITHGFN